MTEQNPQLDPERYPEDAYVPTDEDLAVLPDADDLPDLSDVVIERPPENDEDPQDEVPEGLGALPTAPVRPEKACERALQKVASGAYVDAGYCLRETRGYHGVGPLYLAAKDSLESAIELGLAHRVHDFAKVPRGVDFYARGGGSVYGHIWISLGGGWSISTDWPRNRYGKVRAEVLFRSWGYEECFWAPCVNDTRIWPLREKQPQLVGPEVNRARVNRSLKHPGDYRGETAIRQLTVVRDALHRHDWSVDGFDKHPEASTRRALEKFQRKQGWRGDGADGLLGKETAKRLEIKSRWDKLPEWND